jgi:hypothetical protein
MVTQQRDPGNKSWATKTHVSFGRSSSVGLVMATTARAISGSRVVCESQLLVGHLRRVH